MTSSGPGDARSTPKQSEDQTTEPRGPAGIGPAIKQFAENLEGLREFVEVIEPVLQERRERLMESNASNLLPLILALTQIGPDSEPLDPQLLEKARSRFDGEISIDLSDDAKAATISVKGPGFHRFHEAMKGLEKAGYHTDLLYQNSLSALVSATEWFLSQILRWIFERQPGIAGIEDKTLKLGDLQAMNSIEDAKRYMLESRVLEVLRGGFIEWLTYFEGRLGLSMGYLVNEKGRLIEVFQRRNLFVHNGGYVGETYRKFVPEELQEKPPKHARVSVTRPYLEAAIDVFERCFILLAAELWKKQKIDDDARGHLLLEIAYDRLVSEAYAVAESLSRFAMNDKRLPERIRLSSSFNYWQSLKWQGRFEEVRPEVENLDMSAKDQVFAVARYALLDDEEAFFDALPDVLDRGLSEEDLREWPLFKAMRKSARFQEFTQGDAVPPPAANVPPEAPDEVDAR